MARPQLTGWVITPVPAQTVSASRTAFHGSSLCKARTSGRIAFATGFQVRRPSVAVHGHFSRRRFTQQISDTADADGESAQRSDNDNLAAQTTKDVTATAYVQRDWTSMPTPTEVAAKDAADSETSAGTDSQKEIVVDGHGDGHVKNATVFGKTADDDDDDDDDEKVTMSKDTGDEESVRNRPPDARLLGVVASIPVVVTIDALKRGWSALSETYSAQSLDALPEATQSTTENVADNSASVANRPRRTKIEPPEQDESRTLITPSPPASSSSSSSSSPSNPIVDEDEKEAIEDEKEAIEDEKEAIEAPPVVVEEERDISKSLRATVEEVDAELASLKTALRDEKLRGDKAESLAEKLRSQIENERATRNFAIERSTHEINVTSQRLMSDLMKSQSKLSAFDKERENLETSLTLYKANYQTQKSINVVAIVLYVILTVIGVVYFGQQWKR